MPRKKSFCRDCKTPLPLGRKDGHCEGCKEFRRRMHELHGSNHSEAYVAHKRPLVEKYEAIVASGGRLFE